MKITIALVELEDDGALPTGDEIRALGHDLTRLLGRCATIASRPSYCVGPAASADASFLASDADLHEFMAAATAYGGSERYADLARFLGDPRARGQDPGGRMGAFETSIMKRHPEWLAWLTEPNPAAYDETLVRDLTRLVLRLARALGRLLAWGLAGELGRETSVMLRPLIILRDEELGALPSRWRV